MRNSSGTIAERICASTDDAVYFALRVAIPSSDEPEYRIVDAVGRVTIEAVYDALQAPSEDVISWTVVNTKERLQKCKNR